jgi:8-oxo-dGTP pyrophosphatase MutT (NUDIX family)
VEEFESLVNALKREVKEETGLEITHIEGLNTRLETGSTDANVECLTPFAVYQTLKGPVDSMGVYFLCRARVIAAVGDTEDIHWMPVQQVAQWMKTTRNSIGWTGRASVLP